MKVKTFIPLILAGVLGLAALFLVRTSMSGKKGPVQDANIVLTVAAAHDIEPGSKISATDLTTTKTPKDSVPIGSFTEVAQLVDRVTTTRVVKGQTVMDGFLAPEGTAAGVQAFIEPGMRAITLQVSEFSGLAGLLVPGCKVDIISVIRAEGQEGVVSRTIVQNVEVRAIGRQIAPPANPPAAQSNEPGAPAVPFVNNVTLLVTPEQAEAVQLASVGGTPWLVLRNAKDEEPIETEGVSMADLRGPAHKGAGEKTQVAVDPFDNGKPTTATPTAFSKPSASNGTRTVTFIRAGKVESVQVETAPTPPMDTTTANTKEVNEE